GHPEITAFVLDDGFQHRRAARALDLVLLDAANPFGHGHVLPRGLLREPAENLARANAVLVTRAEADLNWAALCHQIRVLAPAAPVFRCRHICRGLVDAGGCPVPSPGRVLALSGIGNPDAFITSLMDAGIDVGGSHAVADHHVYAASDLVHLKALCDRYDGIVTTEKDWVKLRRLPGVEKLPFYRSQLVIDFADDQAEALFALIEKSVQAARIVKH
ncbi:MAG TPA: tetraacyldisaccharide 4'-kinase, partial [Tepidisphaeraceae bacterium]